MLKSAVIPIGHISLVMKLTRKPSSGNPNAGFEVAGAGNVLKYFSGAPVLDPTVEKSTAVFSFKKRQVGSVKQEPISYLNVVNKSK